MTGARIRPSSLIPQHQEHQGMTKRTYRVLIGMNYPPNDTRAEPGDVRDDIPPGSVGWLLKAGAIEPVEPSGSAGETPEDEEEAG
jgi:hypothetical protein